MQLIYQTTPKAAVSKELDSEKRHDGTAYLRVFVYEIGDSIPIGVSGHPRARPLSYWRQGWRNDRGRPFTIQPGPLLEGVPPIAIPSTVLDALSDDANVEFQWIFMPRKRDGVRR
jgi:hypothetical protein